jgi:hypothetical protein
MDDIEHSDVMAGGGPQSSRSDWAVPVGPWFRERPQLAVAISLVLFGAMCTVGFVSTDARDAAVVALVLPVALLAVTFGRRGGIGGAIGVLTTLIAWQAPHGHGSGALWAGAIAIVLLGQLLGEAVDQLMANGRAARAADARRLRAENAARRLREAAAVNDTLVQSVAVAKWALEAGDSDRAVDVLDEAVERGQRIVSDLLRDADFVGGDLLVDRGSPAQAQPVLTGRPAGSSSRPRSS